ncbi:MAG: hypothetical protein M1822_003241 [Bathelium mastoideum]|nr:MAG: hypothetical protein M1822_003241 [Bathelium mastoideum]
MSPETTAFSESEAPAFTPPNPGRTPSASPPSSPRLRGTFEMPGVLNTVLIEGSFDELAEEFATYLDQLKKSQGDESSNIQSDVAALQGQGKQDDVLKKLVSAADTNTATEFIPAYSHLLHLVRQSDNENMFLARICQHLSKPITSSPTNGPGLALSVLSTIFNVLEPDDDTRYNILLTILAVIRQSSNFESLKSQLKNLDRWIVEWELDDEQQRKLFLTITDVASDVGEDETAYQYLIRALRTIPTESTSDAEATALSLRALQSALTHPAHFDFQDLTALDSVQALRRSHPVHFELLEIFSTEGLDEFDDFQDEHAGWLEQQDQRWDVGALTRKMRLLTLTSMAAAASQTRQLPYADIASRLKIAREEVEVWVIDVIRAGLVEGKLSQQNQLFLIHRSTYRVFGEREWREVASRLDLWRTSLVGVLNVVRQAREERLRELEADLNGPGAKA